MHAHEVPIVRRTIKSANESNSVAIGVSDGSFDHAQTTLAEALSDNTQEQNTNAPECSSEAPVSPVFRPAARMMSSPLDVGRP